MIELVLVIVGAVLGVAVDRAERWLRRQRRVARPGARLWGWLDSADRPAIVISTGPHRDDAEYTDTVYPAEALAAREIAGYLADALNVDADVRVSARVGDDAICKHLILIGGPVHNEVSRRVFDSLIERDALPFTFDDHRIQGPSLEHPLVSRLEVGADGVERIKSDVALIVRTSNPFNRRKGAVLIAGARTHGCLAGARALVGEGVEETLSTVHALGDEYAMVVAAEVQRDSVGEPLHVAAAQLRSA